MLSNLAKSGRPFSFVLALPLCLAAFDNAMAFGTFDD